MPGRVPIIRRLDAALAKMRDGGMEVRAIYLTAEDWDDYNAERSAEYGSRMVCFRHGDHEIRRGETSRVYSTHGVGIDLPKRVPA